MRLCAIKTVHTVITTTDKNKKKKKQGNQTQKSRKNEEEEGIEHTYISTPSASFFFERISFIRKRAGIN